MGARNALPLLGASRMRTAVSAAIRVPERMTAQLALVWPAVTPQIFVHEGARQALERRMRSAFGGPVNMFITDNRHSMISHSRRGGALEVRLRHMFLDAPPRVLDALVRYIACGDREASSCVGQYIEANAS